MSNINGINISDIATISYAPNKKRPSGKSFARYEQYMHATTLAEYFELNEKRYALADLKYDEAAGFVSFYDTEGELLNGKLTTAAK